MTFVAKRAPSGPCAKFIGGIEIDPMLPGVCQVCEWDREQHSDPYFCASCGWSGKPRRRACHEPMCARCGLTAERRAGR